MLEGRFINQYVTFTKGSDPVYSVSDASDLVQGKYRVGCGDELNSAAEKMEGVNCYWSSLQKYRLSFTIILVFLREVI